MKEVVRVMKALSDQNRIRIIKMLEIKEMCVCEIRSALGLAQPTVSKHLKILEDAGLVEHTKDGLWVNYRLAGEEASSVASTMLDNLAVWLAEDPEVGRLQKTVPTIDRLRICNGSRTTMLGSEDG